MNIIQIQDDLKNLPDQALQKELLQPSGTAPGFLVLTELQRRKQMRSAYEAQKQQPNKSMAEEFAQGLGGAQVGAYPDAVRGSMAPPPTEIPQIEGGPQSAGPMPSSPMAEQQPQGFADGGAVSGEDSWYWPSVQRWRRAMNMPSRDLATMGADAIRSNAPDWDMGAMVRDMGPSAERWKRAMNTPSRDLATMGADAIRNAPDWTEYSKYGTPDFDMDAAMRDAKNPFWRVSRGKTEVAKPGFQDYPPDLSAYTPYNKGLPQQPMPDFGGPNAQGIAGILEQFPQSDQPRDAGGNRPPAGVPGGPAVGGAGGAGAGGAGRGVGGALNIGGEGLADYVNEVRALQMPDRFTEMEERNREDRDKLLAGVEGDKGMALLTAGLGIMGGESPFAAVNIGRGAQAGVKYWNDAQKELRLAQAAIRQAENQITIARANRDEKQLETGLKLYATAQEKQQAALNRANSSGIAAADRAQRMELARMELDSKEKDRQESREQSRINEFGTMATRYTSAADAIDMKIATLQSNLVTNPEAAGQIAKLQAESQNIRAQAENAAAMHRSAVIDREVRAGRIARPEDEAGYAKLKSGTRYVAPDGTIRVKP